MSNTEIMLANGNQSLAEMMGLTENSSGKRSMLPRFAQISNGIKGDVEINGKTIKADVVPAGAYKLTQSDDKVIYATNPQIRIFAQRMQWTRWDADAKTMIKTLLVTNLKGDLKDNAGTFNAGRPSGFVEDFKSLPKETQELMRNTRQTKVVFGVVIMKGAVDEAGEPINDASVTEQEIPFVMDVKSKNSRKAIDDALKAVQRKNALPIQYYLDLDAELHDLPNGSQYAVMTLALADKIDIQESDKDILDGFMDWVAGMNNYINDMHEEAAGGSLSGSAEAIINDIVEVEVSD